MIYRIACLLVCTPLLPALAQGPDRAGMFRGVEAAGNGFVGGHAVATANDADLGDQIEFGGGSISSGPPFSITADFPFFYTSNARLVRDGAKSDFVLAPEFSALYQPHLTEALSAEFSVSEQLFYFARRSGASFGSFGAQAGVDYELADWNHALLRALYDYQRQTPLDGAAATYSSHGVLLNAEVPLPVSENQRAAVGLLGRIDLSAFPSRSERYQLAPYLSYSIEVARHLSLNAYAELDLRKYAHGERREGEALAALSASYELGRYLRLSLVGSAAANRSNESFYNYNVGNLGGAFTLNWRF